MRESVATTLFVAAVAGGFLNVAASLLGVPPRLEDPSIAAAAVAASALALALTGLLAWPLAAWIGRATGTVPRLAWLGLVLVSAGIAPLGERLFSLADLSVVEKILAGVALFLGSIGAAGGGYALDRRLAPRTVGTILAAAPPLGAAVLLVGWVVAYPLAESSIPARIAGALGAAVVTLGAAIAFARRARHAPALPAAVLALAALVASLLPAPGPSSVAAAVAPHRAASPPSGGPACAILLTVDSLRADALPFHDPTTSPKPAIDALYDDSVVFAEARSAGPWTKPGFASMLTGLSPRAHAATRTKSVLPERATTLAEEMRSLGYRTAAIGYNPVLSKRHGFGQGFDDYHMYPGPAAGPSLGVKLLSKIRPGRFDAFEAGTEDLADTALSWIDDHEAEPFFLWLHFFDPHLPYAPPPDLVPPADPDSRIADEFNRLTEVRTGRFVPTRRERWRIRELYDAEVRLVDAHVGRVLEDLRARDLYDRCLIVFTSDHGEELFDHQGFEHGHTIYDEVIAVPLAVKLPDAAGHRVVREPVSTASVFATVLELAGDRVKPARGIAPSLASLWSDGTAAPPFVPLAGGLLYYEDRTALVLDGHKYVRTDGGREIVYDLERDPGETRPLDPPPAAVLEHARARIDEHEREAEGLREELLAGAETARELSRDQQEHLRALGYVD